MKPPEFKIEKGASLHVIRPAKFVDPDEVYWNENTKKFTEADRRRGEGRLRQLGGPRPQLAVVANTGAGADIVRRLRRRSAHLRRQAGRDDRPRRLSRREVRRLVRPRRCCTAASGTPRTGSACPIGGGTGPVLYRKSWVNEVGYDEIPNDLDKFLDLCQKLQKAGHPFGMSLGHALGDANGFSEWLLWTHDAFVVDENGQGRDQLQGDDRRAEIRHRAAEDDDPRHAVLERRRQQQGLRVGRDRHDVQRRVALLLDAEVAGSEAERDRRRHA